MSVERMRTSIGLFAVGIVGLVEKQGIIVGGEIPDDLLEQARAREERRRARAEAQNRQ